jgi:hypothetical protein
MTSESSWYQTRYRRMLVDMHIPDWDPAFLASYDPRHMIDLYVQARVNAVMFYCQSHVGLCYWPTVTGKQHAGLRGRDVVGELLGLLKERDIAATAYYSLIFNNQALLEHPDWGVIQPHGYRKPGRYGHVCLNNPDYRDFALAQTEELITGYDFDGFFFDMTFWPGICVCAHCRRRYLEESGQTIPLTIDWLSPDWCAFQASRERWLSEFAGEFTAQARLRNTDMPVYHNFATALSGWLPSVSFSSAVHHTFLGADFYGDRVEQLLACKTMLNLSENRPIEFMTSRCLTVFNHVTMKPEAELAMQAYAAMLFSAAFLFIDAVNPDGTIEAQPFACMGEIFAQTGRYEPYLGGDSVEDIGVYFSDVSRADFSKNGTPLEQAAWGHGTHMRALRGICRLLQEAHLPFGVITRKQLPVLDRYKVLVLPDVTRMDLDEVEAIRAYVRGGGRVYASGMTSLTETRGVRHDDFLLADLFGCHFSNIEAGVVTYLKPATQEMADLVLPQKYVQHDATMLRLRPQTEGEILATLSLPYGSPEPGSLLDHAWASIHTSPPWDDTEHPVLVRHAYGNGHVIYCGAALEAVESDVNTRVLAALVRDLLVEPSYTADAHPAVWMNVMHQLENQRFLIGFLNAQSQLPPLPVSGISFTLRPPVGAHFTTLVRLPDEAPVPFELADDGTLHATAATLETFALLMVRYAYPTV